MTPKVFVVLVVMNLDEVAIDVATYCPPLAEVHDDLNVTLAELIKTVGLLPNLGATKLVDVVVGNDGTLVIGYRVRTRSRGLRSGFNWCPIGDVNADGTEERYLLDRAWELEET